MENYDARLGIFSTVSVLTDKLQEKFKEKYLDVEIFSNTNNKNLTSFSYLIINLIDIDHAFEEVKNMISGLECKIVVLLPLYAKQDEKDILEVFIKELLIINSNIGTILVPELLGYGVKFNTRYVSHNLIMQSISSERVKISNSGLLINTVSISKLIEKIVKETFSFGVSGQTLALVGPRRGQKSFLVDYLGVDEQNIISTNNNEKNVELERTASSKMDFSLLQAVKNTKKYFSEDIKKDALPTEVLTPQNTYKENKPKVKTNKFNLNKVFKYFIKLTVIAISILILPILTAFLSISLFLLSFKFALSNLSLSERLVNYSINTMSLSQKIMIGTPFYSGYSNVISKSINLFHEVLETSRVGSDFATKVVGKEAFDLPYYTDNISASLDKIHTDVGFLQGDINDLSGIGGSKIKQLLIKKNLDIGKYKNKIYQLKTISSRLSVLLGMDKPQKYLILFQNNMELRPTGGFIGSFALVTFDKGKMTELVVNDVYSADGQLKGHVDPPEPINLFLGEGGWYMRDANWDPSFPESATKIEWFLDKETNNTVDGVIAIDLNFVQKLLKITGPILLTDFNKTITAENLYTSTQSEVESDFFAGSIKKASYMTALSRQLLNELQTLKKDKYFSLMKEIYTSLEERHVQVYLHDTYAEEALNILNYSGKIDMSIDCGQRCLSDSYSYIDANLGVNKANMYVRRSQLLNINVDRQNTSHELIVNYQNMANQSLGNSGKYKTYSRLIIPKNTIVSGVRIYDASGGFEDLNYNEAIVSNNAGDGERKEIGFLVEVLPGDSKKIQIVWSVDSTALSDGGEYRLYVRKQAGTEADDLKINITNKDLALTGRVPSVYTTTLARDFSLKLFFKQ